MTSKVYLLMYGYVDDRRIGGVFSTRSAAEAAMRFGDEYSAVLECDVDPLLPPGPSGRSLWYVEHGIRLDEYIAYRQAAFEEHQREKVSFDGKRYSVSLWARNEEDALRLGKELFSRFKQRRLQAN